jgi:hypothetical protein
MINKPLVHSWHFFKQLKNNSTITKLMVMAFLLLSVSSKSQIWSEPQPFTDGESNKANPYLGLAYDFDFLLLYEQSTDSISTSIYYHRYLTENEPVIIASEPNVHFKNPVLFDIGGAYDTSFIILFEKHIEDQTEIRYIKFANDGGHSESVLLSEGGVNNNLLSSIGSYDYAPYHVAWNSDNNLLVSKFEDEGGFYFHNEPDTLFNGEILDIAFMNHDLFWIVHENNAHKILKVDYNYPSGWTDIEEIYSAPIINAFRGVNHLEPDWVIAFSYKNDDSWQVNNYAHYYNQSWFYPLELSSQTPFDFDVYATDVSYNGELQTYFLAYVGDTMSSQEIFINQESYTQGFSRLSYLGTTCRNPKFYLGDFVTFYDRWCYLFFEVFTNGYWQLYTSRTQLSFGSIEEKMWIDGVSFSPNPATDYIHIQNEKEVDLTIEIFDVVGNRVYQDVFNEMESEIKTIGWKRGVYFVNVRQGNIVMTTKLVLM